MNPASPVSLRALLQLGTIGILTFWQAGCSKPIAFKPVMDERTQAQVSTASLSGAAGFGSGSFYPLTIGNQWSYQGGGETTVLENGSPVDHSTYAFTDTHELIGTTHHEGTGYVVEEQVHHSIPENFYGPVTYWFRMRQDRNGLFALDTLLQYPPPLDQSRVVSAGRRSEHPFRIDPATLAPGRVDPSLERFAARIEKMREAVRGIMRSGAGDPTGLELTFLLYPLRHGETWSTRPDFPWPIWVDGVENLSTPAGRFQAYRLGINPDASLEDGESVFVWYSRQGYLGYSLHALTQGTDPDGNPTGLTYVFDESMRVTSLQVAHD